MPLASIRIRVCLFLAALVSECSPHLASGPLASGPLSAASSAGLFKAPVELNTLLSSWTSQFRIELSFFSPLLGPVISESPFC